MGYHQHPFCTQITYVRRSIIVRITNIGISNETQEDLILSDKPINI